MVFPDKKPGVGVMIAIGKPKGGPPPLDTPGQRSAPKPSAPMQDHAEPDADDQGGGISPEDVDYSANDLCETCKNMSDDGSCAKYGFPVEPTGHCEAGYEPKDQGHEQGQQFGSDSSDQGDYGSDQSPYGSQ